MADPATRRDIVILESLQSALALLRSADFAPAFGGSANQSDYRWGHLHRLVIDHPLGDAFSLTGDRPDNPFGRRSIIFPACPSTGGSKPSMRPATARGPIRFRDSSRQGPLRRFVTSLGGGRRTESSLPGGVSGDVTSPFFNNLLGRWLTNESFKWRELPLGAIAAGQHVILTPKTIVTH